MRWQSYLALMLGAALVGCGAEMQTEKHRTLVGVPAQQILIDAQHTLALEGLDIEEIDFDKGEIKSTWERKNRRQYQYLIKVTHLAGGHENPPQTPPAAPEEGAGQTGENAEPASTAAVVDIVVSSNVREKAVGGWSTPKPSHSRRASNLLDDIVELSVTRFSLAAAPAPEIERLPENVCSSSVECPPGTLCGSGQCVSECVAMGDCGPGNICDERGRCVVKAEPCPEPPADSEAAEGSDADAEKEKAASREGKESHADR